MNKDAKISSIQLFFLLTGFIYGSTIIAWGAKAAYQDAWLAYCIGWAGGFVLIGIYAHISLLHPGKSLVEISRETFGPFLGTAISQLYIWYFLHLAALVVRDFTEFTNGTIYYKETPPVFVAIILIMLVSYALKSGAEVIARIAELLSPILPILFIIVSLSVIHLYDFSNILPFLERGIMPVLKTSFSVLTFPFGETVAFLMFFQHLNQPEKTAKISYWSVGFMGFFIFIGLLRNIFAFGPDILARLTFPSMVAAALVPNANIDPFIGAGILVGGLIKISVCMYGAVLGIAQLFNLDDYKPFVLPVGAIVVPLSIWIHENIFELFAWAGEIYPYYAVPFQIVIPLIILMISWMKKGRGEGN